MPKLIDSLVLPINVYGFLALCIFLLTDIYLLNTLFSELCDAPPYGLDLGFKT